MDVLLELSYALGTEGMADDLPLSGMLCSVSRVEETALYTDEGIVELCF